MTSFNRKLGHKVSPLSEAKIVKVAQSFRDLMGLHQKKINICALLELLQDFEMLEFEVVEDHELGDMEAQTLPDKGEIKIKKSVYDRAARGDGHCRFTIAHEIGHLMLHKNQKPVVYARGEQAKHAVYEDSEWQADVFASEFLMDTRLISESSTPQVVAKEFGASEQAASMKLHKLKMKKGRN